MEVDGRVVLEDGSPVVWFTFPGLWHDIGRFHRADGTFTGLYANILTPVRFLDEDTWETTDLYLDVWVDPTGRAVILDEDELLDAEARGWVEPALVEAARAEATLLDATRLGEWPRPWSRRGRWNGFEARIEEGETMNSWGAESPMPCSASSPGRAGAGAGPAEMMQRAD